MESEELIERVRVLRARRFTAAEIARALGIRTAEAARLVRLVAIEREEAAARARDEAHPGVSCWVSPGWRNGLSVSGHDDWPDGARAPAEASGSGAVAVLVARRERRDRMSVCGYLVDTWCLGVKDALGPKRMSVRELDAFRSAYFAMWESAGIPAPLELAQDLVLGAEQYARRLGFKPNRDLRAARGALGAWEGPSAISFGRDGVPFYINGPYDDPESVLATLDRTIGRDGYQFIVELGALADMDDGYEYSFAITNEEGVSEAA